MDVGLNTDRMLAYFDTSGHDVQGLREIHGREPAPEYLEWGLGRGIFARDAAGVLARGPHWGDPRRLCGSDSEFEDLLAATPALYGFATAGARPAEAVQRRVRIDHAEARASIHAELSLAAIGAVTEFRLVETAAASKAAHLSSPDLGARLASASATELRPEASRVQILVSDGLSAGAVHHNLPDLLPVLRDGFAARGWTPGTPLVARYGRVKLAEEVAERLGAELVVYLIGERPGGDALASRSLSAYLAYRRADGSFEYTVVANIHAGGLPPLEAGALLVEKVASILGLKAAGNRLEALLAARDRREAGSLGGGVNPGAGQEA
jgi:ethanolamine ammonia-lyase large subunit